MAVIEAQSLNVGAHLAVFVAAEAGGDSFLNSKGTFIFVKNADVVSHTITIAPIKNPIGVPRLGENVPISDIVIAVPPSNGKKYFSVPSAYTGSGGFVDMTYDAAGLSIAILRTRF